MAEKEKQLKDMGLAEIVSMMIELTVVYHTKHNQIIHNTFYTPKEIKESRERLKKDYCSDYAPLYNELNDREEKIRR